MLENVETIEEKQEYKVSYNVPIKLKSTLDMCIEEDIGHNKNVLLWDCQEEVKDKRIIGCINIIFDEEHPYNEETLQEVSYLLETLSKGQEPYITLN